MIYKFKAAAPLSSDSFSNPLESLVEGLQGSGTLVLSLDLSLNTQLPDDKLETLISSVSEVMSKTLGQSVTAELTSKEH